ncbi:NAD-dependent epimerase/dehydratase family protein [Clostridium gasigenes]|uniref:NAD-dependent epimerase/dehydratase family protein n=1 Tax=Clostridium gasigenes TaxID=94869 RepID=UPI001C0AFDB6|nr:NAD(P)-dependent oxidoreductase [Clostridium gasigenes]MBU3104467.1 NAD(P)-dependent oxidoreductase [Clostridium gasigenes]
MKILITGAGGWLGSELTKTLLDKGNHVKALSLGESKSLEELKSIYNDNLEIINANITDTEIIRDSMVGVNHIYHLAAKVHYIPISEDEIKEFFNINTGATENIFKLAIENNVERVIFYSTVSVYEESNEILNVNNIKKPKTPYGKSKLMAEKIGLKLYKEKGLPLTIIEPVTVYGGADVGNFKKLEKFINKGVSVIFGDGENKKTVIYYKDLIEMTINIAKDNNAIGKVIICGTENISVQDINKSLISRVNKRVLKIRINKWVSKFIIKVSNILGLSIFKKIGRQIKVLMNNNIYEIEGCKRYVDSYTTFYEYFNKREKK